MPTLSIDAKSDVGAALLLVLIATVLLAALGLGLLSLTSIETQISANGRDATSVLYAAEAGVEFAVSELRRTASWSDVLTGTTTSAFIDVSHRPITPFLARLDLDAITLDLNAASATGGSWGADAPAWRLFSWGSLRALTGPSEVTGYVAIWVADDTSESDGDPLHDVNGVLSLHGEAFGSGGARRSVDAVLARFWHLQEPPTGPFEPWPDLATRCAQLGCYDSDRRYWPPGLLPAGTPVTGGVVRLLSWREG